MLARESPLARETGGNHAHLGQKHQHHAGPPRGPWLQCPSTASEARPPQAWRLQALARQPLSASRQDPAVRGALPVVHASPTALVRPSSPPRQLSPQPPPCWLQGGLCSLLHSALLADLVQSSSFLLAGAEGQAQGSSATSPHPLPLPAHCPVTRLGRCPCCLPVTCFKNLPRSLCWSWPSSSPPELWPPKPDLQNRAKILEAQLLRELEPTRMRTMGRDTRARPHVDASSPFQTRAPMGREPWSRILQPPRPQVSCKPRWLPRKLCPAPTAQAPVSRAGKARWGLCSDQPGALGGLRRGRQGRTGDRRARLSTLPFEAG